MSGPATRRAWRDTRCGPSAARGRRRGLGKAGLALVGGLQPELSLCQPSGRGKYRCLVCGTVHADTAALALHQASQRHAENLRRLRAQEGGVAEVATEQGVGDGLELAEALGEPRGEPRSDSRGETQKEPRADNSLIEPLLGEVRAETDARMLQERWSEPTATGLPHISKLRDLASKISNRARPRQFLREYYETGEVRERAPAGAPVGTELEAGTGSDSSQLLDDFSFSTRALEVSSGDRTESAGPRIYIPPRPPPRATPEAVVSNVIHPETGRPGALLELLLLDARGGGLVPSPPQRPTWRIVSAFEQIAEPVDPRFQYLVVACPPYANTALRIPNLPVDPGACSEAWFPDCGLFCLQLFFGIP